MKPSKKWMLTGVVVLALAGAFVAGAQVKDLHASHAHPAEVTQPAQPAAPKWATDASLRQGMTNVRELVQAALPGVHGGYTPADYLALATGIEKELGDVITHCTLAPEADAQLHVALAEFYAGTAAMKQDGNRVAGVLKVISALKLYADSFDHPGWVPVQH